MLNQVYSNRLIAVTFYCILFVNYINVHFVLFYSNIEGLDQQISIQHLGFLSKVSPLCNTESNYVMYINI